MKAIEVHVTSDSTIRICKHIVIWAVEREDCADCDGIEILQMSCAPCRRKFEVAVHSKHVSPGVN